MSVARGPAPDTQGLRQEKEKGGQRGLKEGIWGRVKPAQLRGKGVRVQNDGSYAPFQIGFV